MTHQVPQRAQNKFAVVLPVYNVESYIRECLDSIQAQTHQNFTVFAVNDGTKDNSGVILDEYAKQDHRFVIIHKHNAGVSSARNVALEAIEKDNSFDFVYFLDPDDKISPLFMETFVRELSTENADYGVCSFQSFTMHGKYNEPKQVHEKAILNNDEIAMQYFSISKDTLLRAEENAATAGFLCNRVFKATKIKGLRFNEKLRSCEDRDFFVRLLPSLNKGVLLPNVLFFYRMRISSLSHSKNAQGHDFFVFENFFNKRFEFSKAIQIGIQAEYLSAVTRELNLRLISDRSHAEKLEYFKYCQDVIKQKFDFPIDHSVRARLSRIRLGYTFCYLFSKYREHRKKIKSQTTHQKHFYP